MKAPKRVKGWVNGVFRTRHDAAGTNPPVRVVELRRGEVIVDVEALVTAFWDEMLKCPAIHSNTLRAALRKVGKR